MTNTNISNARSNLFKLAESCIEYSDVVNINTKKGNVIMISEEEYNGMVETLYLLTNPEMRERVKQVKKATADDFVPFSWED